MKLVTAAQDYKRHTASRMIPLEAADVPRRLASAEACMARALTADSRFVCADPWSARVMASMVK